MNFAETSPNRRIWKIQYSNNWSLRWTGNTYREFLVLSGVAENVVNLSPQNVQSQFLQNLVAKNFADLQLDNQKVQWKEGRLITTAYLVSFASMMRGDFIVGNTPAAYSVNGVERSPKGITIYFDKDALYQTSLKVRYQQTPMFCSKGFRKKKQEYSGYQQIHLMNFDPNWDFLQAVYHIDSSREEYPVPKAALTKGVPFYVQCTKDESISIRIPGNKQIQFEKS